MVIWKSSVLAVFILTYINLEVPWNIRYGAHADSMPAKVKPFWCAAMCTTCWNVNKRRAFESSSKLQLWRFFLQESVVWFYPPPHACTYTHAHTHTYTHNCIFAPQFVVTNSFSGLLKVLLFCFFKEGAGQIWNVIYRDRTLAFLIVSNKKPHCSWQWHLLGTQYLLPLYSFVCYTMFQKLVTFLDLGCVSLHRFPVWKQDTDETRVSTRLRNHNILSIVNFCLESKRVL